MNSARGDIGAFNLRNLGTGNTRVLLNGRRMVNSAAYQRVAALEAAEPKAERVPEAGEAAPVEAERTPSEPCSHGPGEAPAPKEVEWDLGL